MIIKAVKRQAKVKNKKLSERLEIGGQSLTGGQAGSGRVRHTCRQIVHGKD